MKTLYEGILSDIEDTLQSGDDFVDDIINVFKQLKEYFSKASNWSKHGSRNNITYTVGAGSILNLEKIDGERLRNVLKYIGIPGDHNHIYIGINTPPQIIPNRGWGNYWELTIKCSDPYDRDFVKTVYIPQNKAERFSSVIKNYIKPAMKDINTFKKFIDDIQNAKENILD